MLMRTCDFLFSRRALSGGFRANPRSSGGEGPPAKRKISFTTASISVDLLFVLLISAGCASDKKVIAAADTANTQLSPAIISDAQVAQYIQQIGDRVVAAAKEADAKGQGPKSHTKQDSSWMFGQPMYFHLVNSKTVNAFTTGGHHVYVYDALFQMCKTEDELAAVMSHEFAHVYCRHVQQGNNRQLGMAAASGAAGVAGYAAGGQQNGSSYASTASSGTLKLAQFVGMGFTRKDEAEADEWGFRFYCLAGWDPAQFRTFFQRMIDAGYDKTPAVESDHPTLASRVKLADERAATWQKNHGDTLRRPPIASPDQFAQINNRAQQIAAASPSDANLKQAQTLLASFSSCVAPMDSPDQTQARQELLRQESAASPGK